MKEEYRVLYFGRATDTNLHEYVLNEILSCCHEDRKVIPSPKSSYSHDKEPLLEWFAQLREVNFWESSKQEISQDYKEFFSAINDYYY